MFQFQSLMRRILLLLFLLLAMAVPRLALAKTFDEAAKGFSANSFAETVKAIDGIAASGDPRAGPVLEALGDKRLFYVPAGGLFFKDADGKSFDAITGQQVALPTEAAAVRVNNRVRNTLQKAGGASGLQSTDGAKRIAAADALLKSRDPAAQPALEAAIGKEADPRIKERLELSLAAIIAVNTQAAEPERIAAVERLAGSGQSEALNLLRETAPQAQGALKLAVDSAISAIETSRQMREIGQTIWFGISLGSVLLLAAIGLAITFGVMGVINMAHGEMVMIGAYVTFVVQETMRLHAPNLIDWSLPIALPLAFLIAALIGVLIERTVISFLYGRPLETLLATFGISLILQQAVRTMFGPTNREVSAPSYMSGSFEFLGLQITYGRLWIVVFTLVVFFALLLILRRTSLGLQMRAVTQNRRMASAMGIRTRFVDSMTFALGSGIAGIAGVALSQIDNVSPNLGQAYIIDSFMVVVFGGVGNLWGTLVGAFSLGIANKFLEPFAGAVLAKILILILLILFIQKRPRGLFALKGRAVEA
jgi:urea transport system permease protein